MTVDSLLKLVLNESDELLITTTLHVDWVKGHSLVFCFCFLFSQTSGNGYKAILRNTNSDKNKCDHNKIGFQQKFLKLINNSSIYKPIWMRQFGHMFV